MTRGSFTDTWPTPAEAAAMNAAAADVLSAVSSAADLLDHFRVEMEEGKLRDDAGRRAIQALAEICGLALRRVAEGPADGVSDYASRLADAAQAEACRRAKLSAGVERIKDAIREGAMSHADQP